MQNKYELAKSYVEELKNNGTFDELVAEYNEFGSGSLNDKVIKLISSDSKADMSQEELELVEMKLIVLFAEIKDKLSKTDFVFKKDKDGKNLFIESIVDKDVSSKIK